MMGPMHDRAGAFREIYTGPVLQNVEILRELAGNAGSALRLSASVQPVTDGELTAEWPSFVTPTEDDLLKQAQVANMTAGKLASTMTAARWFIPQLGVEDVEEEIKNLESEKKEREDRFRDGLGGMEDGGE
jgi:hypothetical protein